MLSREKMEISKDSFKTIVDNYQYQQIAIGLSNETQELVAAKKTSEESRAVDLKEMQASLLSSAPVWPFDTYRQSSPYPILVTKQQICNLEALHICLSIAITDIVERWWTDKEARYWERMPIEGHEEDLLRVRAEVSHPNVQGLICGSGWSNRNLLRFNLTTNVEEAGDPTF